MSRRNSSIHLAGVVLLAAFWTLPDRAVESAKARIQEADENPDQVL